MRGLHDKRQLLAKLRIAGSENCALLSNSTKFGMHVHFCVLSNYGYWAHSNFAQEAYFGAKKEIFGQK